MRRAVGLIEDGGGILIGSCFMLDALCYIGIVSTIENEAGM